MSKVKIALAMIVKGDDKEAEALNNCLRNVSHYVDGIFITRTNVKGEKPNKRVKEVAEFYDAVVSEYEWTYDFASARNYNFAQVTSDYTHILWCDADDIFRGLEKLKPTLEEHANVDCFSVFYLYDFDEYLRPTVVHQKTQVIKNNGSLEWQGKLHEDFKEIRKVRRSFIEGIDRIHETNDERVQIARKRNVEVAEKDIKVNPNDPRSYWNLANSLYGDNRFEKSKEAFQTFLKKSLSDEEKYTARLRLSHVREMLGEISEAMDELRYAIGTRPEYPDAYHALGNLHYRQNQFEKARDNFLMGMTKRPPYFETIVYNPRDYDYNPLMSLARTYFQLGRPDQALTCLKAAEEISPQNDSLKKTVVEMSKEADEFEDMIKVLPKLQKLAEKGDKKKLKQALDKVDNRIYGHPAICHIRNTNFIKEESSGRDLVFYCGPTTHEWNPELFKTKGFGGSEEAIVNLAKKLSDKGWNVTVYNNCGHSADEIEKDYAGVKYAPYWMWNYRDKQDVVVLWRHPRGLDYPINADKILVDVHDMVQPGEFTPERLEMATTIMFKTKFHASVFPDIPKEKVAIVPNGMDFELFDQDVDKDQYLIVNTSSPDRSLDVLPELFKRVKEQVPEAKCKWAYGWSVFDSVHSSDYQAMEWKKDIQRQMKEAGIDELGRVTQKECAKLYLEANILGYPTEFAEIDCITVKKAQACGCMPITTDFAALDESVQHGIKIHSTKTKDNWCEPYQMAFGLSDEKAKDEWVEAVVKQLKTPLDDRLEMKEWSNKFNWDIISDKWNEILS